MKKSSQREVVYYFSYLRSFACIGILVLHVVFTSSLMYQAILTPGQRLASSVVCNNLMWAVPCFVMVTGALLLDPKRELSLEKILKKYLMRIVIALVVCVFLFRLIDAWMDQEGFHFYLIIEAAKELIQAASWSHLWYLYLLIGLYLILPIFRAVTKACSKKEIQYLLLLFFLFQSILPLLNGWNAQIGFYIHFSTIYPFYLLLGYALNEEIIKVSKGQSLGLLGISTALLVGLTIYRQSNGLAALDALWGYSSFLVIMQALGVYGTFRAIGSFPSNLLLKGLYHLDSFSFGIYLFHLIFVRGILKVLHWNPYVWGIPGFFGMMIIVFVLTYLLVRLLKKIPYIFSFI